MAVTIDDIRAAAALIEGAVTRTPCTHSRTLSEICGCDVIVKFENLQFTASFKDRGALVKLLSLGAKERKAGVIAASAGNHAQGVAYHAKRLGIPATIVMPTQTPFNKVRQTALHGAKVVLHGHDLSESTDHATVLQKKHGLTFVHPYDDEKIIAGQGTVALEMLDEFPDLDVLVIPIGGGGLISGNAIAAKAINPEIEIVGVEASLFPSMRQAIHKIKPSSGGHTIAEGIAVKRPGKLTLPIVKALVSDVLLVDEEALERAVQMFLEIEKTVAEGAGAAGLAALLAHRDRFVGCKVGTILCGGNIDSRLLSSILMRGLVRNGQLVRLRVEISDAPGLLGRVANLIGEVGGNIVEVYHQRLFHDVPVKMADLDVVVETRDSEHVRELIQALSEAGFNAKLLSNLSDDVAR